MEAAFGAEAAAIINLIQRAREAKSIGSGGYAAAVADALGAAGDSQTTRLNANAHAIVADALARYDGPCPHAYADVVSAYVSAPPGGQDALFLAVARQAVGVTPPSQTADSSAPPSPGSADRPVTDPELLTWARSTLDLLARHLPQARS